MFEREYAIVNVAALQKLAETLPTGVAITPQVLLEQRVVNLLGDGLRILGDGELKAAVTVFAHHFSKTAQTKIETAGGKVEILAKGKFSPQTGEGVS
jgi:large subunit ribosomal protein L15